MKLSKVWGTVSVERNFRHKVVIFSSSGEKVVILIWNRQIKKRATEIARFCQLVCNRNYLPM